MRIILSPAKKMKTVPDIVDPVSVPCFLDRAEEIRDWLHGQSYDQLKRLWNCNDKIADVNYRRLETMDLRDRAVWTPAILAYDGIAFQYMAPSVFEDGHFDYVQEHLRILSGFYGCLRPMDGVVPYRLEMQAKTAVSGTRNLYEYWGDALYREVVDASGLIIDLASKEYSTCIERYLQTGDRYIVCVFGELSADGKKVVQKGVYAKMARGEMVRFMAEHHIEEPEEMKAFDRLGYHFSPGRSDEGKYVFIKE